MVHFLEVLKVITFGSQCQILWFSRSNLTCGFAIRSQILILLFIWFSLLKFSRSSIACGSAISSQVSSSYQFSRMNPMVRIIHFLVILKVNLMVLKVKYCCSNSSQGRIV